MNILGSELTCAVTGLAVTGEEVIGAIGAIGAIGGTGATGEPTGGKAKGGAVTTGGAVIGLTQRGKQTKHIR